MYGGPAPFLDASSISLTTQSFDPFFGTNEAPDTTNDSAQAIVGLKTVVSPLLNDTDTGIVPPDLVDVTQPKNGKVEILGDQLIYTADKTFTGQDRFFYTVSDGVLDTRGRVDIDVLETEKTLGKGDDHIIGNARKNILNGGKGSDTLEGKGGSDILAGGSGKDSLLGGAGADMLKGGKGADVLSGGAGNDSLSGGGGGDTFKYAANELSGQDNILDYVQGVDVIEFEGLKRRDLQIEFKQEGTLLSWEGGQIMLSDVSDLEKSELLFL